MEHQHGNRRARHMKAGDIPARRAKRALIWGIVLALALLAVGWVAVALGEEGAQVTIENPASGSVVTTPTPTFEGGGNGTANPVTLHIYEGSNTETQVQEYATNFAEGNGTWSVTPASALADGTYTVVATQRAEGEGAGTEASNPPVTFTVHAAPVVTHQPQDAEVLAGEDASFSAKATSTLEPTVQWQVSKDGGSTWHDDTTDIGVTTDTLLVASTTTSENGYEYRAYFENASGHEATRAAKLTVNAAPKVKKNPSSRTVKVGENASFTAEAEGTPPPEVQWQVKTSSGSSWTNDTGDEGNKTPTLTVESAKLTESGYEYRAVFKNLVSSEGTSAATLTVYEAPSITTQPASTELKAGEEATFHAEAKGTPTPEVQWELSTNKGSSWSDVSTATSDTLRVPSTTVSENGNEYRATFTNVAGVAKSNSATLTVNEAPVVVVNPSSVGVKAGETATFTAEARGTPEPKVQWRESRNHGAKWTEIAGATSRTYTIPSTKLAETGYEYDAVFTNKAGSITSESATLVVEESFAPEITVQPQNKEVEAGKAASFTAAAKGAPTPGVQWQVSKTHGSSWENVSGATGATLTVSSTTLSENGYQYHAIFANENGTATSEPATLTVTEKPTIIKQPENRTVEAGKAVTFEAEATGSPHPEEQWEVETSGSSTWTAISGATGVQYTISSASLTENQNKYRAVFTNVDGHKTTEQATLTVDEAPVLTTAPTNVGVIEGDSATFSAAAVGYPEPTVQWWQSTDKGAEWTPVSKATSPTLTVTGTTTAESGYEYKAVFSNTFASKVHELATNPVTLTVTEFTVKPAITLQPVGVAEVIAGKSATLSAEASGVPTPTVQWWKSTDGGATWTQIAGATSRSYEIPSATLAENGYEYRAVFTNPAGSITSEPATLIVAEPPVVTISPADDSVTEGEDATFSAAASGTPIPQVQWQVSTTGGSTWENDTVDAGAATDTLTVAAATTSESGNEYRAVFTNSAGQRETSAATLTVTIPPPPPDPVPPVASFTWFPASPHTGEALSLASNSTDADSPITSVAWDVVGNGPFVAGPSVRTISFSTVGNHVVRLRVTDADGLTSIATRTITVTPPPLIFMEPFPVVRFAGSETGSGVKLSELTVQAPLGARITVTCRGHGCPTKTEMRMAVSSGRKNTGAVVVAFPRFEHSLTAGVVLEIRIAKPGEIGKYTRYTIRRGKLPLRTDSCLSPSGSTPMTCPLS